MSNPTPPTSPPDDLLPHFTHVPPSSAVLIFSGPPILVSAPSSFVFQVLVDTSTWGRWNSFVPKCEILSREEGSAETEGKDGGDEPVKPEADDSPILRKGDILAFNVSMNPAKPWEITRRDIHAISTASSIPSTTTTPTENNKTYFLAYTQAPPSHGGLGDSMMRFEHLWRISPVSEDGGKCTVEHWNLMAGWLAWLVKWFSARDIQILHARQGEELRTYCEETWREGGVGHG